MHITHVYPRFKEVHGGGEPVLFNLLRELEKQGHRNVLLTYNFPVSMTGQISSQTVLRELPRFFNRQFSNVLMAGFFDLFANCFLFFLIPSHTDVVCFHTEGSVPSLFFSSIVQKQIPRIYFCFQPPRFAYDTVDETGRSGGWLGRFLPFLKAIYRPLDRWAVRRADAVLTFSNDYKDWVEKIYGLDGVEVLAPGVSPPASLQKIPDEIKEQLENSQGTLIFVGKLVAWKHLDRLIRILAVVKERISSVKLLIVGDGPCFDAIKDQVEDLGLEENVVFAGFVSSEMVFSFCAAADLLVQLEHNVSFGLALVEANVVGTPVMAIEGGGPNDIIRERENGFLLGSDISDLDVAQQILQFFCDKELQHKMRERAKLRAGEFSWQRFAEKFAFVAKRVARH